MYWDAFQIQHMLGGWNQSLAWIRFYRILMFSEDFAQFLAQDDIPDDRLVWLRPIKLE